MNLHPLLMPTCQNGLIHQFSTSTTGTNKSQNRLLVVPCRPLPLTTKGMHFIWKVTELLQLHSAERSNSTSAQLCMAACPKCKQTGLKGQHSCLRGEKYGHTPTACGLPESAEFPLKREGLKEKPKFHYKCGFVTFMRVIHQTRRKFIIGISLTQSQRSQCGACNGPDTTNVLS